MTPTPDSQAVTWTDMREIESNPSWNQIQGLSPSCQSTSPLGSPEWESPRQNGFSLSSPGLTQGLLSGPGQGRGEGRGEGWGQGGGQGERQGQGVGQGQGQGQGRGQVQGRSEGQNQFQNLDSGKNQDHSQVKISNTSIYNTQSQTQSQGLGLGLGLGQGVSMSVSQGQGQVYGVSQNQNQNIGLGLVPDMVQSSIYQNQNLSQNQSQNQLFSIKNTPNLLENNYSDENTRLAKSNSIVFDKYDREDCSKYMKLGV